MDSTKDDFEFRKNEIESYFEFLHIIDDERTSLKYNKNNDLIEEKIPKKLQTMFIANTFLILYNLIESTVRNSIIEIYEKIREDEVSYSDLSINLKKIWLQQRTANLKQGDFKYETLQDNIQEIIDSIVDKETIALTKENINISGNIDAQKVRDLAKSIGFEKSSNEKNGQNLVTIKNKRNGLAHGNHTFYDVGKDYTVKELSIFKQETFDYLFDVITNIEIFIKSKKYMK